MRHRFVVVGAVGLVASLSSCGSAQTPADGASDRFFASVSGLCGKAFAGRVVANEPTPGAADPFEGKALIVHVRRCEKDRLELPFHAPAQGRVA